MVEEGANAAQQTLDSRLSGEIGVCCLIQGNSRGLALAFPGLFWHPFRPSHCAFGCRKMERAKFSRFEDRGSAAWKVDHCSAVVTAGAGSAHSTISGLQGRSDRDPASVVPQNGACACRNPLWGVPAPASSSGSQVFDPLPWTSTMGSGSPKVRNDWLSAITTAQHALTKHLPR